MPWLQLITNTPRDQASIIEDAFINAGAVSVTFQEHIPSGLEEQPILEPGLGETPLWDQARITGLFTSDCSTQQVDWLLQQTLDPLPTTRWEQLEDKDWEREWMSNYQPIQCAKSLWICPSWQSPPDPSATNILLDPGLAFGTGTHPTTFLCMQWLASQELTQKQVIDYGCGSGILGITALKLGAKEAIGIDIDPQALIATENNVKNNGLYAKQFTAHLPEKVPSIKTVDIVIANILAGPLVELADELLALLKPGGKICLSGVLASQESAVKAAYQHQIIFEPTSQKEEWIQLSGHRMT